MHHFLFIPNFVAKQQPLLTTKYNLKIIVSHRAEQSKKKLARSSRRLRRFNSFPQCQTKTVESDSGAEVQNVAVSMALISSPFLLPVVHLHSASRTDIFTLTSPSVASAVRVPRFRRRFGFTFTTNSSSSSSSYGQVDEINGHKQVGEAVYEDEEEISGVLYGFDEYFEGAKDLTRPDGGPPRWFSPVVNGGCCSDDAPLLLYLPGSSHLSLSLSLPAFLHYFNFVFGFLF